MSDGLNPARIVRVLEIMNNYRTLLLQMPQLQVQPSREESEQIGFVVFRKSLEDANNLASAEYQPLQVAEPKTDETEKTELRRVILDGSARRLQAHKIYLRAVAAQHWVTNRLTIGLESATAALRQELAGITDHDVFSSLRNADTQAGLWLVEDPSLWDIYDWISNQQNPPV